MAGGIEVIIYEPGLSEIEFFCARMLKDFNVFKKEADIIICNRLNHSLNDVVDKVYKRDPFGSDI